MKVEFPGKVNLSEQDCSRLSAGVADFLLKIFVRSDYFQKSSSGQVRACRAKQVGPYRKDLGASPGLVGNGYVYGKFLPQGKTLFPWNKKSLMTQEILFPDF